MHMRRKPWARPELEACPYYRQDPRDLRGRWAGQFPKAQPLHVELGCGKGVSTAQMVLHNQDVNFVAIDLVRDVLGYARRNIEAAFAGAPVENAIVAALNIECISQYFDASDAAERIYISFCNPWSQKKKHEKRRLTHPRQLRQYRTFLKDGGEIWFKTDDDTLFDASLAYLPPCGFRVRYLTRDLHQSGFAPNYESEHEIKYAAQGVPIKFLIAVKEPETDQN
ncbi:tRNA (guanosine(46)-N7)-methyltransferase TrmB [Beduinella massiliensis]|uniref:tRNA (guanosine(46)-N7)-methyltransferase TrmB n=1 Tax=Beduinella massiliensis TaxID=1852363 RepID=UPI000C8159C8